MSCRGFKWGPKRLHPDLNRKGVPKPNGSYQRYTASATCTQYTPRPPTKSAGSYRNRLYFVQPLFELCPTVVASFSPSAASGFAPNTTFEFSPRNTTTHRLRLFGKTSRTLYYLPPNAIFSNLTMPPSIHLSHLQRHPRGGVTACWRRGGDAATT